MGKKFNYYKLVSFLFVFITAAFLVNFSLLLKQTQAQIPTPDVPCDQVRPAFGVPENEFNSLRPYQASPCNKAIETVIACGNDLIVQKEYKLTPSAARSCSTNADGSRTCQFEFTDSSNVKVSVPDAELPIVGNTQLVANSASDTNTLDSAQRANQYVSWYLQGTNYRAEDEPLDPTNPDLISYAGPLRKLLPQSVIQQKQIESIEASKSTQHNQVAVCANEPTFGIIGDILGIGKTEPQPCYKNTPIPGTTNGTAYRIEDWEGGLSWGTDVINSLVGTFSSLLPGVAGDVIRDSIGNHWNKRIPPLPSGVDPSGQKFTSLTYQKAYNEWRGKSCVIVPGINFLLCIENIFIPNRYADLFTYVPLASNEDRIGKITVNEDSAPQPESDGVVVSGVVYEPGNVTENLIYVPHMEETSELLSSLQSTYVPKGESDGAGSEVIDTPFLTDTNCDLTQKGWNSGDDLFGEYKNTPIEGTLNYNVSFTCSFGAPQLDQACYTDCLADGNTPSECTNQCTSSNQCEKKANVALSVYTKTPKINNLWYQTVFGDMSVYKRIFPQIMTGKSATLDLPGVTTAKYESDDADATVLAGDPDNNRPGARAEIFIPHLGGIQEYFLKGIQTALRPKGITGGSSGNNPAPGSKAINCNKSAADPGNTPGLLSKETLIAEFSREFPGNHIEDCYNDVVGRAKAAGYDPAFVMAIWIEESGASDYSQFPTVADFGCAVNTPRADFGAQLTCFLGLRASYAASRFDSCRVGSGVTMNDLLLIFSEGFNACKPENPSCYRKFCLNPQFPDRIRDFYSRVSGGRSLPANP